MRRSKENNAFCVFGDSISKVGGLVRPCGYPCLSVLGNDANANMREDIHFLDDDTSKAVTEEDDRTTFLLSSLSTVVSISYS